MDQKVRKTLRATLFGLSLALLAGLQPIQAAPAMAIDLESVQTDPITRPAGTLFIVGGGPRSKALMQEYVNLAGGKKARILVIAMAGTPEGGEKLATELRQFGVEAKSIHVSRNEANTDAVVRELDGISAIWFIGGSQTKLARSIVDTKLGNRVVELYKGGLLIGGTSAGAAIQSKIMITGGEKRQGGDRPVTKNKKANRYITIERDNIKFSTGLGLLPETIIDQHFLRRRRNNRLMSMVLERPEYLGVGIDESTAIVVHPDGHWSVVGESVALVYDARRGQLTDPKTRTLGVAGMTVHILPAGGTFDPATGKATVPARKAD